MGFVGALHSLRSFRRRLPWALVVINMAHEFSIEPEALKRRYSVYVVIAKCDDGAKLYVGKTGDNREGCNPIISRCGNHFSYNKIHSQVRNKLEAHEDWSYTYVFDHFDEYPEDESLRRERIDRINEMERWLNQLVATVAVEVGAEHLNPYKTSGYVSAAECARRTTFRTDEAEQKLQQIVARVSDVLRRDR